MDNRPIWMPDTSVLNALADDADGPALIAGLKSGYFVRFPFTIISEIIATTCGTRRKQLLRVCRTLLTSAGDCIEPHHEILRVMVNRFENSRPLSMAHVNLRMQEAEIEILREENFDDGLAAQEREEGRTNNKVFVGVYVDAKTAFDELAAKGVGMPRTVADLVSRLQEGGAFWTLARNLYERVAAKRATDADIHRFYEECEPFRVLMIALCAAQFDRCIKSDREPSMKAGRNDTFMVTCLPYCHEFVTNDAGQLACYKEVVSVAGLDVIVRSYDEFRNRFTLIGTMAAGRINQSA